MISSTSNSRRVRPALAGVVAAALILSACGSSGTKKTAPAPTTAASTTTTASPPTSAATTTTAPTTAPAPPPPKSAVGLVVDGQGATLAPPASPTTDAFNANCHALVDAGFSGSCVTVTSPGGTIAAIVETRETPGQTSTAPAERDLVYRQVGNTYSLRLRRVTAASSTTTLYASDVNRDGDPKAVFVTPAPNSQFGNELDVVDTGGAVTLLRQLHGGFATIGLGGGLKSFVPGSTSGYDEAVIRYSSGVWRIVSTAMVSQSQATAESSGPFTDPNGRRAE